ncbi:MAG: hypothetical protein IPJ77_23550 [Planctomycetes bacterium]|nr:hypothetical protein [Planctomycetota bacterium]
MTQGIDRHQLKALLRAYFVISTRAMPVGITGNKRVRTLPFILAIYAVLGFVLGAMAPIVESTFVFALFVHTMAFFIVGTMALNEAAEVLFNARDVDVFGFRPVNGPTLVLAKGLTILGFCGAMALAVNLGPAVLGFLCKDAHGWFGAVHLVSAAFETVFLCAVAVCSYGVIARFLGAERFQRFVTAAQIASTLVLVLGFQVLPRLARRVDWSGDLDSLSALWLLPPAWFAALDVALAGKSATSTATIAAAFGVAVTIGLAWLGVLRLPAGFTGAESRMGAPAAPSSAPPATSKSVESGWSRWRVWRSWMPDPAERAVFRLCVTYVLRDRALKVRLAASLAYFLVLPILSLMDEKSGGAMPIVLVWMLGVAPLSALESVRLSSTPEGAELFLFTPVQRSIALFQGARKAVLLCIVLPLVVWSMGVAGYVLRDTPEKLLFALPGLLMIGPMSLVSGLRGDFIPLSQAVRSGERASQVLAMFLTMLPLAMIGSGVAIAVHFGYVRTALFGSTALALALHAGLSALVRRRSRAASLRRVT